MEEEREREQADPDHKVLSGGWLVVVSEGSVWPAAGDV